MTTIDRRSLHLLGSITLVHVHHTTMKKPSSRIRPSGAVLPLILRKKYNAQLAAASTTSSTSEGAGESKILPLHPVDDVDEEQANRVFTAEELERKMMQASVVMVEIQKQLYKGEEVYVEDTHAHGNLYRGWDAFIDLRDGGAGSHHHQPGAHRRIPADSRWFSGSCKSVARTSRPHSRMSVTPTPSLVARSGSTTPVSANIPSAALSDASSSGGASKPPEQPPVVAPVATEVPSAPAVQADLATSQPAAAAPFAAVAPPPAPPIVATQTQEQNEDEVKAEAPASSDALVAPETPVRRNTRKRKQGEN
jgi:hypothetical protein